jgi:prepilin-type N-terminal cleavage/methylation domain-containing protein
LPFPLVVVRIHPGQEEDMSVRARRAGFTLIELLIAVVIVGILASIAIPSFKSTKGKAYAATLRSDLRNLATAQEAYFYEQSAYTASIALVRFTGSGGVNISVTEATRAGWSATATHPLAAPLTCAVFYGNAAPVSPATVEGAIACQ